MTPVKLKVRADEALLEPVDAEEDALEPALACCSAWASSNHRQVLVSGSESGIASVDDAADGAWRPVWTASVAVFMWNGTETTSFTTASAVASVWETANVVGGTMVRVEDGECSWSL